MGKIYNFSLVNKIVEAPGKGSIKPVLHYPLRPMGEPEGVHGRAKHGVFNLTATNQNVSFALTKDWFFFAESKHYLLRLPSAGLDMVPT